jgi:hypothetical protein
MVTPQQFVEAFVQEKTTVYGEANARLEPLYRSYFGEPLVQRTKRFLLHDRQVVDEVKQSEAGALVITRSHFPTADWRARYHLSAVGESWKIVRIDRECFICRGTGRSDTTACWSCGGEGWCDVNDRIG